MSVLLVARSDEQVEEEDLFRSVLDLVKFAGEDKAALLVVGDKIKDLGLDLRDDD